MSERRAPRLALEVVYLAALAAALSFAKLRSYEIAGVMLLGWLLVVVFEWGALRGRAHYGSGLPPRWYVPKLELPPPRPLEQLVMVDDQPTWIASPAMLADWPVADDPVLEPVPRLEEETQVHDVLELELALAVAEPAPELEPEPEPAPALVPVPDRRASAFSRHRIDPFAEPEQKAKRFGRRAKDEAGDVAVPAGPPKGRSLPSRSRSED